MGEALVALTSTGYWSFLFRHCGGAYYGYGTSSGLLLVFKSVFSYDSRMDTNTPRKIQIYRRRTRESGQYWLADLALKLNGAYIARGHHKIVSCYGVQIALNVAFCHNESESKRKTGCTCGKLQSFHRPKRERTNQGNHYPLPRGVPRLDYNPSFTSSASGSRSGSPRN